MNVSLPAVQTPAEMRFKALRFWLNCYCYQFEIYL